MKRLSPERSLSSPVRSVAPGRGIAIELDTAGGHGLLHRAEHRVADEPESHLPMLLRRLWQSYLRLQPFRDPTRLGSLMVAVTSETTSERRRARRLGELYAQHGPSAARLAYLLTGNHSTAEDLVQEAFVRVFGRFRDLRDPGSFEWYLRRTVVNLANSHFRRLRTEREYLRRRRVEPALPSMPDLAARDEMWRALQRLSQRQRAAIVLRFYEDLPEAVTAEVLQCPVGTVKSLVSRGLARLRSEVTP